MKILIFAVFYSSIFLETFSTISELSTTRESLGLVKETALSDVAKEWEKKLGDQFIKIATVSQEFGKYAGPIEDIISFVLTILEEQNDETEEYLMNITKQLDKIDTKLDAISEQINNLDSNFAQSTRKILAEPEFRDFLQYKEEMTAFKQYFESIISSFTSNTDQLLIQLDKFIDDYRQKESDIKLVNILDSGSRINNSIVDDLITVGRSYHDDNFGSSSTMKMIFDVYITALMSILRANIILDSAVNIKSALTGKYYEEDRRYNHYRKNEILQKFFSSLQNTFDKLNEDDMDGFIDFTITGDFKKVRLINVLQYFWENEEKLSKIDTCADDCEHFRDQEYSDGGCYGGVRDCKYAVQLNHTERYLRQDPQYDRIYMGYILDNKWYGYGNDDENDPNMEFKKSYRRGFINCHICKCICDQYSNTETVRTFYTGKISAPDGYVVTGIKIVQKNKAIYPQIQVGRLLPMATVDQNSIYWLVLPNGYNTKSFTFENHAFKFSDPSLIKFSDAVVTGVQFTREEFGVSWSIYGRELVDFNRGVLGEEKFINTTSSNNNFNASNLIPGLEESSKKYIIKKHALITFGISNEDTDAGQSFVPYFDGIEVTFDVKAPLSGITMIQYTNHEEYAGYIRPVISSLNYKKFFTTAYKDVNFVPKNYSTYINLVEELKSSSRILHPLRMLFLLILAIILRI